MESRMLRNLNNMLKSSY